MEMKYHFKISRYNPKEVIFDGMLTFTEAHKYMDEHATFERRVGFEVFNDALNRWEKFDDSYHGGRKVWDKGELYILDPDYRNLWKAGNSRWYVWEVGRGRRFVESLSTKEKAEELCALYNKLSGTYVVESSDINIER